MIRLENVSKTFPGAPRPAVDRLDLDVPGGTTCVLIGPSGCGKTTTMRIVNRLIEPDQGRIVVEGQDVAEQPQDVPRPLVRRHEALDAVGEPQQPDAVVVAGRAQRQQGRQFRGHFTLLLKAAAKVLTAADVDGQHHRQLAFLDEALDERMPHAGGDVPVNSANVVAGLVLADLFERDAGYLEDTVVFAAQQILDGAARPQLQAAHLTQ